MLDPIAIEKRLTELRLMGKEAAKAKSVMVKMDEGKKSLLAVLMKEYAAKGITAANAQEREARADKRMADMIEQWGEAVEQYESARWQLEVAKLGVDLLRTIEASKRAEYKGYGN